MTAVGEILEKLYTTATQDDYENSPLEVDQQARIETISQYAEQQKAVLAALVTSLTKKLVSPEQDIRLHKMEFANGYSGRVFDTHYVTPFIRRHFKRLAMQSGSGWLTRSIEQSAPFDLQFPGRISNAQMKHAFLHIIHDVQVNRASAENYLVALFHLLFVQMQITHVIPHQPATMQIITVDQVLSALHGHFFADYKGSGASRLVVVAIYTIYQLLMDTPRYQNKRLVPLKSHTTSDIKSRTIGDVEIVNEDGAFFEAVEIKHNIAITSTLVEDAFDKIRQTSVMRYYLLTTADPNMRDSQGVVQSVETILYESSIEIIVNGIMPTLKYYLRLLPDPAAFVRLYTDNLEAEFYASTDIKRVHLERWTAFNPLMSAE